MSTKKPPGEKIGNIAPFGLRMLPDLRARIEDAAAESGRSLNAEIVARLEETLSGNMPDLSAAGFGALVKRLEASVESSEELFFGIRDAALSPDIIIKNGDGTETHIQIKNSIPEAWTLELDEAKRLLNEVEKRVSFRLSTIGHDVDPRRDVEALDQIALLWLRRRAHEKVEWSDIPNLHLNTKKS